MPRHELADEIVAEARTWIGTPWRHQGRTKGLGVDCVGVVRETCTAVGLNPEDYDVTGYSARPVPWKFVGQMKRYLRKILLSEAEHGDVLMFNEPVHPCHVGILDVDPDGRRFVIHAHAAMRLVVREELAGQRLERLRFAFRFRDKL